MKQTDKRFVSLKETLACTRRALSLGCWRASCSKSPSPP